jgi:hypothetical protein
MGMRLLIHVLIAFCCLSEAFGANRPVRVSFVEPKGRNIFPNDRFTLGVSNGSIAGTDDQPLVVRIFRGTLSDLINRNTERSIEDCRVYITNVIQIQDITGILDLSYSINETYLGRNASGAFQDTPYVLVVERGVSKSHIFKIRDSEVAEYFNMGYSFVVRAQHNSPRGPISIVMTPELRTRLNSADGRKRRRDVFVNQNRKSGFRAEECLTQIVLASPAQQQIAVTSE